MLQFHGVPDTAHDWVSTPKEQFEKLLNYLAAEKYTVIALRDLAKYVDPAVAPNDAWGAIEDRKRLLAAGKNGSNARPAKTDDELRAWLENMFLLPDVLHVPPISSHGQPSEIIKLFGGPDQLLQAVNDLQGLLYGS